MTKEELIGKLAEKMNSTKGAAEKSIDGLVQIMSETLKAGEKVVLPHIGSISIADKPARQYRNPRTGEPVEVGPRKMPKFRASAALTKSINSY